MSYLDRLKESISETPPSGSPPKPAKPGFGGFDGRPPIPVSENIAPSSVVRCWRGALQALAPDRPLHGLTGARWRRLLEDADWLLDCFGQQAARDGWSDRDMFGVLPGRDAWGGIADRLRASRSLLLTGERAGWRCVITGEPDSYVRGQGDKPPLTPLWEQ